MDKITIKEIIVVEGKDDVCAVKKAVDAQILVTNGYSLDKKQTDLIKKAAEKNTIIILTDSDYAGETIRKRVEKLVGKEKCKHAFISKSLSTKNGDIGIENASVESIIQALNKARCSRIEKNNIFETKDMFLFDLQGSNNSSKKRDIVGNILGIGYCNAKQFLSRLNNFEITKEELYLALKQCDSVLQNQ